MGSQRWRSRLWGRPMSLPERPVRALRNAAEIVVAYLRVRRIMEREPIDAVVGRLKSPTRPAIEPSTPALAEAQRLAGAVNATISRLPFENRCLVRSLVLLRMLDRRGYRAEFVLSAYSDDEFGAHAWIEWEHVPLLEPGHGQVELLRL